MRPWAEHLEADGFRVALPRLPGHGTTWQEMNQTRWQDWYAHVERAFSIFAPSASGCSSAGCRWAVGWRSGSPSSTGDAVAGLAVVNPSIGSADPRMRALPVLRHLVPSLAGIGSDIALPDVLEGAYDRSPLHAGLVDDP